MNEARGAKWEKEAGDKRAPFPLLGRSNVTFGGHEKDDETEEPKETWRNLGTKRESGWNECVSIRKVFKSPQISSTPTPSP